MERLQGAWLELSQGQSLVTAVAVLAAVAGKCHRSCLWQERDNLTQEKRSGWIRLCGIEQLELHQTQSWGLNPQTPGPAVPWEGSPLEGGLQGAWPELGAEAQPFNSQDTLLQPRGG